MKNLKFIGLVLLAISLNACNNTNDDVACIEYSGALAANEIPFVGTWRLTAVVSDIEVDITDDSESNASTDIFAQYSDCQKDAEYIFTTERKYSFKQGQTAIGCINISENAGSWKITNELLQLASNCAEYSVVIALGANEDVFTFESDVSIIDVDNNQINTKLTFTYSKV